MGTKDNPSRKVRGKLLAGGISAFLLIGGLVAYDIHTKEAVIDEQMKLIHDHQQQLDEQGSLINQQQDQMNEILDENVNLKDALEKQQGEYDQTKSDLEKSLKEKDQKIKGLEKDLTAKLEREAEKERLRQRQVAADLAAKEQAKKVAAQKSTQVTQASKPRASAKATTPVAAKAQTKAPAKEVASSKTASSESTVPSRGESAVAREFYVEATGYVAMCDTGCTGITATGIDLRNQPHLKVIAVDPRVIPLGSKVWVEGYGYAIAGDTGGAIKGNKIDLHMPTTEAAWAWGRKTVKIKILK